MGGLRTFPVPEGARNHVLAATATMDDLDRAALCGSAWASKIVTKENARVLDSVLDDSPVLPRGVLATGSDDEIVALYRNGQAWRGAQDGWKPVDGDRFDAMVLDTDEVAFVARAFTEGADSVVMRPYMPMAIIAASDAVLDDLPDGAKVVAVVDELDKSAVMDLVAIADGPKVWRRHDGGWGPDDDWLSILRSVKPPPIVVLEDDQIAAVATQIDEQTAGQAWEETSVDDYINASAFDRVGEMALEFALIASKAASKATPGGRMPAGLRAYWLGPKGQAKIRFGTPGAWRRCYKQLVKYVGPKRAPGTCTNLAKAYGGHGVATHVSS